MNRYSPDFYQSKFDYYSKMCFWTVVFSVLASTTYWVSDCQLLGRVAYECLFPRLFMLGPLLVYIIVFRFVKSYKIIIPLTYVMLHGIMWCTIWATSYLPNRIHAGEGFIVMHLMFMAIGICAPHYMSVPWHSFLILDIVLSYPLNRYESFDLILTLAIPALVAIEAMLYMTEKSYIEHYDMKNQLEKGYLHDQLTGFYNRNIVPTLCKDDSHELIASKCGIIMLDIDFFKKINDTYGHDTGDKVLVGLADIIREHLNYSDYCVRWGGEEFVIFMPGHDLNDAKMMAESIRAHVASFNKIVCPITISAGVAEYNGGDYHVTIKKADDCLYYCKEHGRNQVSSES